MVLNRPDAGATEFRQDIEQITDSYDTYLIDLNNAPTRSPLSLNRSRRNTAISMVVSAGNATTSRSRPTRHGVSSRSLFTVT